MDALFSVKPNYVTMALLIFVKLCG